MNEIQELILDRLMAAEVIGKTWSPGPLQLAVQALRAGGLTRRRDECEALGLPRAFCAAVRGAAEVFPRVDDVRALSIAVFSAVTPRQKKPLLSRADHVAVAAWAVRQVSLLLDGLPRSGERVAEMLDTYLDTNRPPHAADFVATSARIERALGRIEMPEKELFHPAALALNTVFFALHALRQVCVETCPEDNGGRACRDAARLAALQQGLDGAVRFCLDLAKVLHL
jgi:hypothetical protein